MQARLKKWGGHALPVPHQITPMYRCIYSNVVECVVMFSTLVFSVIFQYGLNRIVLLVQVIKVLVSTT